MGATMRAFVREVCDWFDTKELPKETQARQRRKRGGKKSANGTSSSAADNSAQPVSSKRKRLNLKTYKYHRLGDYPAAIRMFGTTDNFTTQTVRPFSASTFDCSLNFRLHLGRARAPSSQGVLCAHKQEHQIRMANRSSSTPRSLSQ